jgi:hypothetical protein
LFDAHLPHIVANVAEMRRAKAEITCLPFATVAALPAQELRAVLRALQLPLRRAPPADHFHGQRRLHVIVELLLLEFSRALDFATVIWLVTLGTLIEGHSLHREAGNSVLVTSIVGSGQRVSLLNDPTLQSFPPDFLINAEERGNNVI